jgi:hypothetical protein
MLRDWTGLDWRIRLSAPSGAWDLDTFLEVNNVHGGLRETTFYQAVGTDMDDLVLGLDRSVKAIKDSVASHDTRRRTG